MDFYKDNETESKDRINIFQVYNIQDFVGKRHIASMFTPSEINIFKKDFENIEINPILKKIIMFDGLINKRADKTQKIIEKDINRITKYFSGRMVSTIQAIKVLKNNGIHTNEEEAIVILDFLYMLANTLKKDDDFEQQD
ncbi:hypothetical protein FW781_18680 [Chryseobacterium panacisoli]|uniref:Uncharacterized protein n=1 Tax=Chryseobacterium panacisoli TaxID=1807141 RepID=A0A5D8ZGK2_9FLAO|nr:hypothetical protein [Chryseobacterium panacisoli]TZF93717.1 hypothetical protein FW781_18680 [Chryseobacterium panacisoli]